MTAGDITALVAVGATVLIASVGGTWRLSRKITRLEVQGGELT